MFIKLLISDSNISFWRDNWSSVFLSSKDTIFYTYLDISCLFLSFSFIIYKILFSTSILSCSSAFSSSSFFSFVLSLLYFIVPKSSYFYHNFLWSFFIYLSHKSLIYRIEYSFSFIKWLICFSLSSWMIKISLFFLSTNSLRLTCKFSTYDCSLSFYLTFEYFKFSYYSVLRVKASLYFLSCVSMTSISAIWEFFMLFTWRYVICSYYSFSFWMSCFFIFSIS